MTRMNVSLQDSLIDDLRRWVPRRMRSEFVGEAVREKLDRLRQDQAVRAAAGVWADRDREDPEQEIRALREGWSHREERLGLDDG